MKKSHLVKATNPPKLTVPSGWWLPVLFGVFNAVLALTQLADFEGFVKALEAHELTGGTGTIILAITIAAIEILSLPVLFRLSLSPAMRVASASSVLLVPLIWLGLSVFAFTSGVHPVNAGYFGGLLPQPFNWWHPLGILAVAAGTFYVLYVLGGDRLLRK